MVRYVLLLQCIKLQPDLHTGVQTPWDRSSAEICSNKQETELLYMFYVHMSVL